MKVFIKIILTIVLFIIGMIILDVIKAAMDTKNSTGGIGPFIIYPLMIAGFYAIWKYNPKKKKDNSADKKILKKFNIKKEIKKLTYKERVAVSILSGWTVIHLFLFLLNIGKGDDAYFWPFDRASFAYGYDFSEFAVYGLVPWIIFIVFKILNK